MNYHQDRILVIGASGGIGSELVKQLSDSGAIFRMGVHSNGSANKLTKFSKGGDFAEIDYEKPDTLSIACKDVDKVFLLISGPQAVEHASRFVNEAMKAGVRYIVKISHLRDDALVIGTVSTVIGYTVLSYASPPIISISIAFAAGAILVMLADSMIPEAFKEGGILKGIALLAGFQVAAILTKLQNG